MQNNESATTGVLHLQQSEQHYHLRRYFPNRELAELVEQFWLVDWDLAPSTSHSQKNLPDPNCHLVFFPDRTVLVGPVDNVYEYTMRGCCRIVGVKFKLGALTSLLNQPMAHYVNKEVDPQSLFDKRCRVKMTEDLTALNGDEAIVEFLQEILFPLSTSINSTPSQVDQIMSLIKDDTSVFSVQQLSDKTGISVRSIQRLFKTHVGLTPKWILRKYRLHHVLNALNTGDQNVTEMIDLLGYSDQAHLINDFRSIIGSTPQYYAQQTKNNI